MLEECYQLRGNYVSNNKSEQSVNGASDNRNVLIKHIQYHMQMYPSTKVNKVLVVQLIIGILLTKHIQYRMQMLVVKTFY